MSPPSHGLQFIGNYCQLLFAKRGAEIATNTSFPSQVCIEVLEIIFVVKITEVSYWTLKVLNTKDESLSIVAAEKINIWGGNGVGRCSLNIQMESSSSSPPAHVWRYLYQFI